MSRIVPAHWLLMLGLTLCLGGCGQDESTTSKTGEGGQSGKQAEGSSPNDPGQAAGATAKIDASTPDGAVLAVVAGLQSNHPEAVWEFLPPKYQADINSVVHLYAESMDKELWDASFGIARKLVRILKEKKSMILGSPQVQQAMAGTPIDQEELGKNWDVLVGLLDTIVESDVSDLDKMKSFDGGAYLASTGGSIMTQLESASRLVPEDPFNSQFKASLSKISASVVSKEGTTAVLKITNPDGQTQEIEFTQIEGKWIPAPLAKDWDQQIARMKESMQGMPENVAASKPVVMAKFSTVNAILDQFDGAQNAEEFSAAVQQAMLPVMMMVGEMIGGQAVPANDPEPTTDENSVDIIIAGKFEEAEVDKMVDAVDKIVSDAGAESVDMTYFFDDTMLTIAVSPVKDLEAFAKKIEFGKVKEIDLTERTITVEVTKE